MFILKWLVAQWPLAVAGALAAAAIAGWVERLKRVQELELKIKQLQREDAERDRRVILPTKDEIERYAGRRLLQRPDLFLGVIAIVGPVLAVIYQLHATTEFERLRDFETAQIQEQIDETDREIAIVVGQLDAISARTLRELSGRGSTGVLGEGPVYRALLKQHDEIAARLEKLQQQKKALVKRKTHVEESDDVHRTRALF